jgi:hypothetical protein
MPAYRRQHYLPAVYLKQFSADGPNATRTSSIWRLDQQRSVCVSVESQCAKDYFYSLCDPEGTEEMFRGMEAAYGRIAQKIWSGEDSTERDFFGLILMMFDLHCRNVCYANRTQEENVHAYRVRIHCLRQILMGDTCGTVSDQQFGEHLRTVWRVRLLKATRGDELATCDNPVLWFTFDETADLHLMVMPVTPFYCAVAFDRRFSRAVGSNLSTTDESHLNNLQVLNCCECLFTLNELTAGEQQSVRDKWKGREKPFGYVDEKQWSASLKLADRDCFSFLTKD